MGDSNPHQYLQRISSCLRTILDLEPQLEKLELGHALVKEFVVLKNFMERIEEVELKEEDVERIERATANFLEELEAPLAAFDGSPSSGRLLQ